MLYRYARRSNTDDDHDDDDDDIDRRWRRRGQRRQRRRSRQHRQQIVNIKRFTWCCLNNVVCNTSTKFSTQSTYQNIPTTITKILFVFFFIRVWISKRKKYRREKTTTMMRTMTTNKKNTQTDNFSLLLDFWTLFFSSIKNVFYFKKNKKQKTPTTHELSIHCCIGAIIFDKSNRW